MNTRKEYHRGNVEAQGSKLQRKQLRGRGAVTESLSVSMDKCAPRAVRPVSQSTDEARQPVTAALLRRHARQVPVMHLRKDHVLPRRPWNQSCSQQRPFNSVHVNSCRIANKLHRLTERDSRLAHCLALFWG